MVLFNSCFAKRVGDSRKKNYKSKQKDKGER